MVDTPAKLSLVGSNIVEKYPSTMACDTFKCNNPVDNPATRWLANGPGHRVFFCSLKCLIVWALMQAVDWSKKEPWKI